MIDSRFHLFLWLCEKGKKNTKEILKFSSFIPPAKFFIHISPHYFKKKVNLTKKAFFPPNGSMFLHQILLALDT